MECSLNSRGRDTQLFSVSNGVDNHNQNLEKKLVFGNVAFSSRNEDKSHREFNFDAAITAAKVASEKMTDDGKVHIKNQVLSAGIDNIFSLDSLFRDDNL